jgi:hypothetical protein
MVEQRLPERHPHRLRLVTLLGVVVVAAALTSCNLQSSPESTETRPQVAAEQTGEQHEAYSLHRNIPATTFWVGEQAGKDNRNIHNLSSAWVDDWVGAFGGVDDPDNRCANYQPCGFTPRENPFYYALPYNDLNDDETRKESAKNIPWYNDVMQKYQNPTSVVKNTWAEITVGDKKAYAQWEDSGPYTYDEFGYVFRNENPPAGQAGIDLSPAVADYFGSDGLITVSWRFIKEADVPDGPWKLIVTTSN